MSRMTRKIMRDGMRGRKTLLLSIAAVAAALASLMSLAGAAQAYNEGDCNAVAPNIVEVDTIRWGPGPVDFGDGWHVLGWPLGDAVVCWSGVGNVHVVGRLYADSSTPIEVAAQVTFFRVNGTTSTLPRLWFVGKDGQNRFMHHAAETGNVNKVRIRLFNCGNPDIANCQVVSSIFAARG